MNTVCDLLCFAVVGNRSYPYPWRLLHWGSGMIPQMPRKQPWWQGSWGQHGAHLGPTGPRWAPCWPHELCSLGTLNHSIATPKGVFYEVPVFHYGYKKSYRPNLITAGAVIILCITPDQVMLIYWISLSQYLPRTNPTWSCAWGYNHTVHQLEKPGIAFSSDSNMLT